MPDSVVTIAIFASGAGTNAQKLIDYFRSSTFIHVGLIVCNKPGAGVLQVAHTNQLPILQIEKKMFELTGYIKELRHYHISFIVLAGFLWKIPHILIQSFAGKIINIHPALLPAYGGKGLYGAAVHEAVINAGERLSGITIHYVDDKYDHGEIIFQATCDVNSKDTPQTLANKIHEMEYAFFAPQTEAVINKIFIDENKNQR